MFNFNYKKKQTLNSHTPCTLNPQYLTNQWEHINTNKESKGTGKQTHQQKIEEWENKTKGWQTKNGATTRTENI